MPVFPVVLRRKEEFWFLQKVVWNYLIFPITYPGYLNMLYRVLDVLASPEEPFVTGRFMVSQTASSILSLLSLRDSIWSDTYQIFHVAHLWPDFQACWGMFALLLKHGHPGLIVDIPWSEYGWLYPGPAPLILPPNYHKCAPGLGSSQASGHRVMKSKGLRRGQLSSPFSLLLRENGTFDGQGTMTDPSEIWASSSSPAAAFPKVFSNQNWCVLGNGNSGRASPLSS